MRVIWPCVANEVYLALVGIYLLYPVHVQKLFGVKQNIFRDVE